MRILLRIRRLLLTASALAVAFTCAMPAAVLAQDTVPKTRPVAPAQVRDTTRHLTAPTTALFRSLAIPGWGQFSVGAYTRGAFFVGAQSASWYMLLKTMKRLGTARDTLDQRVAFTTDTLQAAMAADTILAKKLADPLKFQEQVDTDVNVHRGRGLVESRSQQRQDWITYTLFFTFASGVDAYVAAQLADFPATIDAEPTPTGGMQLQIKVPLPRKQ